MKGANVTELAGAGVESGEDVFGDPNVEKFLRLVALGWRRRIAREREKEGKSA